MVLIMLLLFVFVAFDHNVDVFHKDRRPDQNGKDLTITPCVLIVG